MAAGPPLEADHSRAREYASTEPFAATESKLTFATAISARDPPETSGLLFGNDRNGAGRAIPSAKAEWPRKVGNGSSNMRLDDGLPILEAIYDRKGQSVLGLKFVLPLQCQ